MLSQNPRDLYRQEMEKRAPGRHVENERLIAEAKRIFDAEQERAMEIAKLTQPRRKQGPKSTKKK